MWGAFPVRELQFDTRDHTLDVWFDADGTSHIKDAHELEEAERFGHHPSPEAEAIRAEMRAVLESPPIPTGWEEIGPDPAWPTPTLPHDWPSA